jgi:hypothetical protein
MMIRGFDLARGQNFLHHGDEKRPTGLSVLEETGR